MKNPRLNKGYGMVSNEVIRDPNLSLREKGVYAYLSTYANKDNVLTVSVDRAASECGVDQSTIRRILDTLKKSGVIVRESRGSGNSYKTTLIK